MCGFESLSFANQTEKHLMLPLIEVLIKKIHCTHMLAEPQNKHSVRYVRCLTVTVCICPSHIHSLLGFLLHTHRNVWGSLHHHYECVKLAGLGGCSGGQADLRGNRGHKKHLSWGRWWMSRPHFGEGTEKPKIQTVKRTERFTKSVFIHSSYTCFD